MLQHFLDNRDAEAGTKYPCRTKEFYSSLISIEEANKRNKFVILLNSWQLMLIKA